MQGVPMAYRPLVSHRRAGLMHHMSIARAAKVYFLLFLSRRAQALALVACLTSPTSLTCKPTKPPPLCQFQIGFKYANNLAYILQGNPPKTPRRPAHDEAPPALAVEQFARSTPLAQRMVPTNIIEYQAYCDTPYTKQCIF